MAIRQMVFEGDELLNRVCRPVERFDARLATLIADMKETLAEQRGVGLAAPQIGVLRRIFIVDTGEGNMVEFINPEILAESGQQRTTEGCLSCPGRWGITLRPQKIRAAAYNVKGERFEFSGEDLMAKCVSHENDHLNGILFTSKVIEWVDPEEVEKKRKQKD